MEKPGLSIYTASALRDVKQASFQVEDSGKLLLKSPAAEHIARLLYDAYVLRDRVDDLCSSVGISPHDVANLWAPERGVFTANILTHIKERSL